MDRHRAGDVVFVAWIVAGVSAAGAWGYWKWREGELRVGALADDMVASFGVGRAASAGPSVAPFWILVGVGVLAAVVAVVLMVALWVTPQRDP